MIMAANTTQLYLTSLLLLFWAICSFNLQLTESKSVQAMCQAYAAVSYFCIGDAESSSQEFARDRLSVELAQECATAIYANQDSRAKASSSAAAAGASLGASLGIVLAVVMGTISALRKP